MAHHSKALDNKYVYYNVTCIATSDFVHYNADVIYQTRKLVVDHISKDREESWKYDA